MFNKFKRFSNTKIALVAVKLVVLVVTIFSFTIFGGFKPLELRAAGVTPTITPSAQNVSTAASVSIAFTTSVTLNAGVIIDFSYPTGYTGTVSTANTTVNAVAPTNVSNATSGGRVTSSLTLGSTITATSTVTIATSALTSPAAAGNYSFTVRTSADSGANFQYVGQANVVQVRAFVPVSLSFDIRNAVDTANTNVCDLGTATIAGVSTCSYRLKVSTNATNGFTVSVSTTGDLTNGSYNMANAAAGAGGTGGTNIVAGTETYGVVVDSGVITSVGGTITRGAIFNAGATNSVLYNYGTAQTLLTANKGNNPTGTDTTNTSLITHNLGISSDTATGSYTQDVTYTIAPSF